MNGHVRSHVNRDTLIETCAAELALAAYRVALRTRMQGTWLDLEMDLWRAGTSSATSRTRTASWWQKLQVPA
jgi:hypothetical protein